MTDTCCIVETDDLKLTLWLTPAAAQNFLARCMHSSSLSHATRQPSSGNACRARASFSMITLKTDTGTAERSKTLP